MLVRSLDGPGTVLHLCYSARFAGNVMHEINAFGRVKIGKTHSQLALLCGIRETDRDPASSIIPTPNHAPVEPFDDLLGSFSSLESIKVEWISMVLSQQIDAHLTKAMMRGGLLSRVWKNRLLLILCGETSAASV